MDHNALFVNLNLDLTKNQLESLLSDEISNMTDRMFYVVDVVVKYKLKQYPDNFHYFLKWNFDRLGTSGEEVDINDEISQVINIAAINKEDEDV
jgi:hypothetical protein